MPRRRRRKAAAATAPEERGLLMRAFLYSPRDMIAGFVAFAAASAIVANALFLQSGPHPAPMFGSLVVLPAANPTVMNLLPRPRPAEADVTSAEPGPAEIKPVEPKPAEPRMVEKAADPLAGLVKSTTTASISPSAPRPPASIPVARAEVSTRRVAAVQRVLTEYGYGQLKPTGTVGTDTQAAIQKFERQRKLPVTGQVSDRLVHELAVVTGHPVD
jgi:putative peptidoglycan binding protein